MRKLLFLFICGAIFATPHVAAAVTAGASISGSCTQVTPTGTTAPLTPNDTSLTATANCATSDYIYYHGGSGGASSSMNYRKQYCKTCNSGYHLEEKTQTSTRATGCTVTWTTCTDNPPCAGLVCQNELTWTNHDNYSTNHNQMRCNTSTDKCEFRCASGYYDNGRATIAGSTRPCSACPLYATCAAGDSPKCNKNYYRSQTTSSINGITYKCNKCPTLGTNSVAGLTSSSGATNINACYIPANVTVNETEGRYLFTSNCNYSCFTDCRSNTSYQNSIGRQFPGLLKTQFRQMIACISCINSLI